MIFTLSELKAISGPELILHVRLFYKQLQLWIAEGRAK